MREREPREPECVREQECARASNGDSHGPKVKEEMRGRNIADRPQSCEELVNEQEYSYD